MQVKVLGSNMEIGEALTSYVQDHIDKMVTKFFGKALGAEAHFKKDGHFVKVILIVNEGVKRGIFVKSDGEAGDAYGAFNEASKKAENQLRRYHDKIKNYRNNSIKEMEVDYKKLDAKKYVIPPMPFDILSEMESEVANTNSNHSYNVIAEKSTEVETLTLDEAIMKMDLANLPTLVFINKENGRMNVVYHRRDGLISHIDPQI